MKRNSPTATERKLQYQCDGVLEHNTWFSSGTTECVNVNVMERVDTRIDVLRSHMDSGILVPRDIVSMQNM